MPDYQNAKIYKIYSYENDDVYYGSTCDTLSRRISGHRTHLKRYKENNSKYYYTSFKILELPSCKIELVENFPCFSKEELIQREGFYIRNNNCVNKNIPNRTQKEYYKEYYEKNKDHKKEYRQQNKEQIKEQRKEYKEQNKDKIKEQNKEYRQRKKEQQLMFNQDTYINKI